MDKEILKTMHSILCCVTSECYIWWWYHMPVCESPDASWRILLAKTRCDCYCFCFGLVQVVSHCKIAAISRLVRHHRDKSVCLRERERERENVQTKLKIYPPFVYSDDYWTKQDFCPHEIGVESVIFTLCIGRLKEPRSLQSVYI